MIESIDPEIEVVTIAGDITYLEDAQHLLACDFVFSATDTQFARFALNAVCHQFLIPGAQVGAKVVTDDAGDVCLACARSNSAPPNSGSSATSTTPTATTSSTPR